MSAPANNAGCLKTALYLGLAGVGLLLGWQLLLVLSAGLGTLSLALFEGFDASYGQLGGLYGYGLLGLGLGAAAGAVAAQQRFRLSKLVMVVAVAAIALLLGSAVWVGTRDGRVNALPREQSVPASASNATAESAASQVSAAPAPTTESLPPATAPIPADSVATVEVVETDTTSQPAQGLRRVVVGYASLRTSWADSLAPPEAQLREADTVRLLRQAHHWARVVRTGADSAAAPTGWLRLAALRPLRTPAPAAPKRQLPRPAPVPQVDAPAPAAAAPAAPVHPTGHQQYTGYIGQLQATYFIDWQANGVLSGSYFYNQKPAIVYRLTGEVAADGALHLLEFTRGRQSARCVLQHQAGGYAGTMFNTGGQQLAMSLE